MQRWLSADVSTETLQARKECYHIFKVMKEKNLQPGILCPVRLLIRFDREIKFYGQVKANRIQHHQTSSATNGKGTFLGGKQTSELKTTLHIY